ncbi:CNOT2/3/5 family protein [Abortiporus biennis]
MNRAVAGQPPQRPPSLGPNPALGAPFRGPYQGYALPPRNVMSGYPGLPNHRAGQNIAPQPSPNFMQQRGQSNFPFAGSLQQQQSNQGPTQHTPPTPLPHTPLQQQPPTQPSTTANSTLPPHIQQSALSSLGTAPSGSSASDFGVDPNDFPALGSTPTNALNTPSTTNATSYASQAGTGVGGSGSSAQGGNGAASQQRDFTVDDFPALGGQQQPSQTQGQTQQTSAPDGHPPGLNGFQQHNDQHRQTLLGSLSSGQQQPGLLNLTQARGGFQSEADKRNYTLKLNNQTTLAAAQAAWNSPTANTNSQTPGTFPTATSNGTHTNHMQTSQQAPPGVQPPSTQTQQHIGAPPGVPAPSSFTQQPQQAQGIQPHTPYAGNGTVAGDTAHHPSQDKWGLLGLLAMIKSADMDTNLLSVGTDLGTMGLDMQTSGSLYSTFITPWADSSAAHSVEPDFHLPACYNVAPPPPGPNKAAAFSDETLFFMFYSSPRDALQEVAAQELYNRNWRYHKENRLWITKETGTSPSQKLIGGEQGIYSFWDPENWEKSRKEMTVMYSDLEEKSNPVFPPSQTLQMGSSATPTNQQQQPQPQQQQQPQIAAGRVGSFQGMGMAAM